MKTNSISLTVIGSLFFAIVVGVLTFQQVAAQVATSTEEIVATSSESVTLLTDATVATTTTETETVASSTEVVSSDTATTTSTIVTSSTESSSVTSTNPPPEGLTEVHIIGKKYIDYFTDGTTVTSYPGDPEIDSHLAEKDAPIPTHEGLTWKYTIGGGYIYDTVSGDLEVGQYAVLPDGSYIEKRPTSYPDRSLP